MRILLILSCIFIHSLAIAKENGIERLMQGNMRYTRDELEHPNRNADRRQAIVSRQEPFAVIVGCSDSRVSPEIIFDQGVGDLFVVRVAGNVIGPLGLDSIEFAALYLRSSEILVLGHENCGAVDAVIQGTTEDIEAVAELIEPAVREAKKRNPDHLLEAAIKTNARRMRDYLLNTPVIRKLVADNKLQVHAGYYHLKSGKVELLN